MYLAVQMVVVQFTTLNKQMVNQQTLASTSPTNIAFKLFSSKNMCMYVCFFYVKPCGLMFLSKKAVASNSHKDSRIPKILVLHNQPALFKRRSTTDTVMQPAK